MSTLAILGVVAMAACAPTVVDTPDTGETSGSGTIDPPQVYSSVQEALDAYPIEEVCGDEDITLAFPTGITNPFLKFTYEFARQAAELCPNVGPMSYTDAQLDQQKAVSDVNSLVAQGVNGIVTLPIFGDAQLPSLRNAQAAGTKVVTLFAVGIGEVPTDVSAQIGVDAVAIGARQAEWLNDNLGEGTVIYLGNAPGQPSSVEFFGGFNEALKNYPGLELVEPDFVPTDNSAVTKKQVMTAMLAKHGRIDAVVTDNGLIDSAVIEAYQAAGMELPYLANGGSTNALGCLWEATPFPTQSWASAPYTGWMGTYFVLAAINDIDTSLSRITIPATVIDTEAGMDPVCDPTANPDTDWFMGLDKELMAEVLG